MPKSRSLPMTIFFLYITLLLIHTHLIPICNEVSAFSLNSLESPEIGAMLKRACSKKGGQCIIGQDEEEEEEEMMMMESEINRRVLLMQKKYISYDTLKKDIVPCERPGASYYNCRAAGVANPYTRGCEVIARCARDVRDINS